MDHRKKHIINKALDSSTPLDGLTHSLQRTAVCKFFERMEVEFPESHLKDVCVDAARPGRLIRMRGKWMVNFGSDSFLGLDEDPRLHEAIERGLRAWGTHNGTSRGFSSVAANVEAEKRLAEWLGAESTLIYPSATLANHGALPALLTRHHVAVADQHVHTSVREGLALAASHGVRIATFAHNNMEDLERVLRGLRPYKQALVAVDGVYSMSGALAPLHELNEVALRNNAVLYVDDAHGTGVVGEKGQGTVMEVLGGYRNVLMVGSLSKALSCAGGFITCPASVQRMLKMRSSTFIFGGPVPPAYLEAVCSVVQIVASGEYKQLRDRLEENRVLLFERISDLGLNVLGGATPIISLLVGDEATTFKSGRFLFDRGFYVQSVAFPAVSYHAGVLRIQVNANHSLEQIEGLGDALEELSASFPLPRDAQRSLIGSKRERL